MTLDPSRVQRALDALPVTSDATFQRVAIGRRLRFLGDHGHPDLVDELSARIICSGLRSRPPVPVLVVLPDNLPRRSPLLFATALVMDGVAQIAAHGMDRQVLYVANYPGIRSQLGSIRLGRLGLGNIFTQQYGRGRGDDLRPLALPGGINLPSVVCIYGPADPRRLLRDLRPNWIAVDCSQGRELHWLADLLTEAGRAGIPVVGWTSEPLTEAVPKWLACGGGLFRWPRLRRETVGQIDDLAEFAQWPLEALVTPRVLVGAHVAELSAALARASEALLAARELQNGRLSGDAVLLGWRYLRALEAVPVPLDVYEREVEAYWGLRRLAELRGGFERFIEAVARVSPRLEEVLRAVEASLEEAHDKMLQADSPLWLGLANLCIESGDQRSIVFPSKSRREMFSFCLLARFNISEDDLRDVGVSLTWLGANDGGEAAVNGDHRSRGVSAPPTPLFVGLPSRFAEGRLEPLLQQGRLDVLVWPHQELVLARRIQHLSDELGFASRGLRRLDPALEDQGRDRPRDGQSTVIRLAAGRGAAAGSLKGILQTKADAVSLWRRPDAADAIASLFTSGAPLIDDDDLGAQPVLVEGNVDDGSARSGGSDPWIQEAIEIRFDDGRHVLLPTDETVNVIVRSGGAAQVEQRYVRALQPGDEVLFIQGQRRQSLYELLVSRVHRDPVIAQYIALVTRWQDDFVRAFGALETQGKTTPEHLLASLRERGSQLTSPATIRTWVRRLVLAPLDVEDLLRVGQVLSLGFVTTYYKQIHRAGRRLKGLHINLSARLNRWLTSGDAGLATQGSAENVIDAELGLTVEDFRHSLLRLRVRTVRAQSGPFFRPHLGQLEEERS